MKLGDTVNGLVKDLRQRAAASQHLRAFPNKDAKPQRLRAVHRAVLRRRKAQSFLD
jgi:hypothetical protein